MPRPTGLRSPRLPRLPAVPESKRWAIPLLPLAVGALTVLVMALAGGAPEGGVLPEVETPVLALSREPRTQAHLAGVVGLDRRIRPDVEGKNGAAKGCVAVGAAGGPDLFADASGEALIPASTTKLVTAYAALRQFGPDHKFSTDVYSDGSGTIWLVGGGDPLLATPEWMAARPDRLATPLQTLADKVKASGVEVNSIMVDNSHLDRETWVDGWEDRYRRDGVAPAVSALAVDRSEPVFPAGVPRPTSPRQNPDLSAGYGLARLVGRPSVPVGRGGPPEDARPIASVESAPMSTIVHEMNTYSDNFVAEVLIRQIGRAEGDGSTAAGVARVSEILAEDGLDPKAFVLQDGSGLHRGNRISCTAFVDLLQAAAADRRIAVPFQTSLAVGGSDGTLEKRSVGPEVVAKTGTLNDVSTLVGYAVTPAGPVPFAIMDNEVTASGTARAVQDRIAEDIALWPSP